MYQHDDVVCSNQLLELFVIAANKAALALAPGVGVFDVFGNALASDSNGDVVVPVSPIPVYIKADDSVLLDVFLKNLE